MLMVDRAERRRLARAERRMNRPPHSVRPDDESEHGVMVAWAADDPEALAQARRETHDRLIETMGAARTGGVTWRHATGEAAKKVIADLYLSCTTAEEADYYRRMRACLREYGGYIIIASAPGDRAQ